MDDKPQNPGMADPEEPEDYKDEKPVSSTDNDYAHPKTNSSEPNSSSDDTQSQDNSEEPSFTRERLKYQDPFSGDVSRKGLLLSNQIEWFCDHQTLIETGYKRENLRPASYTLTIGPDYVDSAGRIQKLDARNSSFYMEPNSIVYVSTAESLNLPFYIAARFNLRVKWVYRGILLGTGPQVEPGFNGYLSCPLFNLTDRAIKIKMGDLFATIDFERTTTFGGNKTWIELRDQKQTLEELDEVTADGERFLLFKQRSFPPLKHLPDHDIVSSLVQLSDEVKRWRAIGIGIVIAFVSLALTLLNFQNNLYREQKATSQQVYQLEKDLGIEKSRVDALQRSAPPTMPAAATTSPRKKTP